MVFDMDKSRPNVVMESITITIIGNRGKSRAIPPETAKIKIESPRAPRSGKNTFLLKIPEYWAVAHIRIRILS
jgi:hypothetical protein